MVLLVPSVSGAESGAGVTNALLKQYAPFHELRTCIHKEDGLSRATLVHCPVKGLEEEPH